MATSEDMPSSGQAAAGGRNRSPGAVNTATHEAGADRPGPAASGRRHTHVRWTVVGLCFAGTAIDYVDRANLSVAAPFIQDDFQLSDTAMGLVLGAFNLDLRDLPSGGRQVHRQARPTGYVLLCRAVVVAVHRTDRAGHRLRVVVRSAARTRSRRERRVPDQSQGGLPLVPVRERAFATSIYDSGARAGTALSAPLVAFIIAGVGWRCRVDQEVGWAARLFSDRLIRIGACLEFSQRR